jgi:hypothetical protein
MRISRRVARVISILPLGSCALVGPLADRDMERAPYEACASFAPAPATETEASPQCLAVLIRDAGGDWRPFSSGSLRAGDELLATPSAAPACQHGNFTHFVLTGSAQGGGVMRVAVPDVFTRGDLGRTLSWRGSRRSWAVGNIGAALHLPAGVRVSLVEGEVRLDRACLKSYTRWRLPPPETDGAAPR